MKLSALLLLVVSASICAAQANSVPFSSRKEPEVGIVDDQALSRAAAAMAAAALIDQLQKMMDRVIEASCPVVVTSAWLTPHLMLLRSESPSSGNGVDLQFRNASGKEIRSMELSATILVKKSIYDLNYLPAIHLYLTAYGTSSVDETFTELRHLSLPTGIHPALVQDLTLQQVTFADGSVWTGRGDQRCGFKPGQTLPVAR